MIINDGYGRLWAVHMHGLGLGVTDTKYGVHKNIFFVGLKCLTGNQFLWLVFLLRVAFKNISSVFCSIIVGIHLPLTTSICCLTPPLSHYHKKTIDCVWPNSTALWIHKNISLPYLSLKLGLIEIGIDELEGIGLTHNQTIHEPN